MTMQISKHAVKACKSLVPALLITALLSGCAGLAGSGSSNSDDLVYLWSEGNDAYALGNFEAARANYEKLIAAAPDNVLALVRLGNIDYRLGDLAGARDYYQRALKIEPRQPQVHYNLAMVELSVARRHLGNYITASDIPAAGSPVSELIIAIDRFGGMSDAVTQISSTDSPQAQAPGDAVAPTTDDTLR
ncbi:MAG TPA: tetratricopeptide repeat protein [Modicisalibacter sp.]|nr:tetratricopeptide repeat protein [Modicisalibacter sp.]